MMRTRPVRRPLTLFAVSCVLALGAPTGAAADATAAPPVPDPLQAALMRDLGLTAEQVVALQESEVLAAEVEDTLRGRFAGWFGGTWIDEGTNQVVVGITDPALAQQVRDTGAVPQLVAYPEIELDLAVLDLDQAPEPTPDAIHGWYVDVAVNRIVVETLPGTASETWAYLGRTLVRGSGIATVEETDDEAELFADMRGGEEYRSGGGTCSIGFPVSGGFVTAGHCGGAGTQVVGHNSAADTGVVSGASYPGDDYGWVQAVPSWRPTPIVDAHPGMIPVLGSREASRGSSVCRSGLSGIDCGRIKGKNKTVKYGRDRVGGLTKTNICSTYGDSGGSMISSHQAQGMVSGGSTHCNIFSHNTYFQPVNEVLSRYGLTLTVQRLCSGMTWSVAAKEWDRDLTLLSRDQHTDAYNGDTACYRQLPMACLQQNGLPLPPGITPTFTSGWTGGTVQLTQPVAGSSLRSRAAADAICAGQFGNGWRMAEFHDGGGGWGWWAQGDPQRMWVAINDQPANPWNTNTGFAMSWTVTAHQFGADVVNVGHDYKTNAYSGDTPVGASLPVLCLRQDGRAAPAGVTPWARGEVRMTAPVPGTALTSRFRADVFCMSQFGLGWRMAEFHDGGGGWSYWASGDIGRMWVAIDDQLANPWS